MVRSGKEFGEASDEALLVETDELALGVTELLDKDGELFSGVFSDAEIDAIRRLLFDPN